MVGSGLKEAAPSVVLVASSARDTASEALLAKELFPEMLRQRAHSCLWLGMVVALGLEEGCGEVLWLALGETLVIGLFGIGGSGSLTGSGVRDRVVIRNGSNVKDKPISRHFLHNDVFIVYKGGGDRHCFWVPSGGLN